ncbi:Metal Ion (Mn2 -iron) Transporter (Nramp) Family [Phytophthora cinnamomi]|uniref:Metal Ion (Mn2 -iron) Transporter (Nramp) Family n=1 Tax=Phytophthora cinnamomi TaxID=4785 RepID=UPI003559FB28|nr:Metal Ion (Mn2 -iron) Transporter (Nramp) Family [Phytophthora cinnamomi]
MSMAYLDPRNLEADLQRGAHARHQLLYVILLSTSLGGFYQVLASRLVVTTANWPSCAAPYLVSFTFSTHFIAQLTSN